MGKVRHWCLTVLMLGVGLAAHAQQKHSDGLDTFLEYMPYASVFTLKACGVEARDDWKALAVTTAASWVAVAGTVYLMKNNIREQRPDGTDWHSFPSGHASIAFAGATMLHKEFGRVSPWISVAGYGVATFVGVDRVLRDRHHWYDVLAGAGIGFAATEVTWWLSRKVFKGRNERVAIGFSGNTMDVAVTF